MGDYTVTGTVKQTEYQIPFAEDRADPLVYKWQWTHEVDGKEVTETKFLMIASNDIQVTSLGSMVRPTCRSAWPTRFPVSPTSRATRMP